MLEALGLRALVAWAVGSVVRSEVLEVAVAQRVLLEREVLVGPRS